MTSTKFLGTVAYWNADRGFGFIRRESDQASIFAHISEVDDAYDFLPQGQRVEFGVAESERKPGHPVCIDIDVIRN